MFTLLSCQFSHTPHGAAAGSFSLLSHPAVLPSHFLYCSHPLISDWCLSFSLVCAPSQHTPLYFCHCEDFLTLTIPSNPTCPDPVLTLTLRASLSPQTVLVVVRTSQNVLPLLVERSFWCSPCSQYKNTNTPTERVQSQARFR